MKGRESILLFKKKEKTERLPQHPDKEILIDVGEKRRKGILDDAGLFCAVEYVRYV